jgi:short-subunit dehydrogenase
VYGASKFALDGLMQGYAGIAALYGVAVTNIQPGPVATAFATRLEAPVLTGAVTAAVSGSNTSENNEARFQRGLRNLAAFNKKRLSAATMTAADVAEEVLQVMEAFARGDKVPLSLPVGEVVKKVRACMWWWWWRRCYCCWWWSWWWWWWW